MISLPDIAKGGKPAVARALRAIESHGGLLRHADLLDTAVHARNGGSGHVIGLTGPPGVGKSTLTGALARHYRGTDQRLAVLAVDPSSRVSGGALLGDRTRLKLDPEDQDCFVRSMAARDRLGGLSDNAMAATTLFAALYDRVIVESVGIGQSEADVALVADTVVLCIQPGSGDSLQFMKAGVMEIPDIVVVTKADMGDVATRAIADVTGALTLSVADDHWSVPVIGVSARQQTGLGELANAIENHRRHAAQRQPELARARQLAWVEDFIRREYGRTGLIKTDCAALLATCGGPYRAMATFRNQIQ